MTANNMPKRPKARVVKCVRRRYARGQYTDMGGGNCCSECNRGASKDQSSITNRSPMLSSGECKSIVFGPASPQGLPLRVSQIYGIVRFKATIPASNGDNPQPVTHDIPVNGLFNEQNNPLLQSLVEIVDSYFVPKIVGRTQHDCGLIAYACRGFGFCKLLIMAQGARFACGELQSDFIWVVVQQIDGLLQKSLLKVRSGALIIDKESSSQLIIWYYAMSKLKRSMECAKHSQSASLFGSRELFQHVWSWVGHVWDELSDRWKTACRQHDDFYKGFRTPHEEIAKMVRNFTVYFEMSMWELPAQWELPVQPSGPVDFNGFNPCEPPIDWPCIQQTTSSAGEAYDDARIARPHSQNLGHHLSTTPGSNIHTASLNPLGLSGNCQLPFNRAVNRYTASYNLNQYPGNFQTPQAGYGTWPPENQTPFLARGTMGTSPTTFIPEENHFSTQGTPFYQQPYIEIPTQSRYLPLMLSETSINHTFQGDADTTPRCARDEYNIFLSTMHQQHWPLYYPTAPIYPHHHHTT